MYFLSFTSFLYHPSSKPFWSALGFSQLFSVLVLNVSLIHDTGHTAVRWPSSHLLPWLSTQHFRHLSFQPFLVPRYTNFTFQYPCPYLFLQSVIHNFFKCMSFPLLEILSALFPTFLLFFKNEYRSQLHCRAFLTPFFKLPKHLAWNTFLAFNICYPPLGRFSTQEVYRETSASFSPGKPLSFNTGWMSNRQYLKGPYLNYNFIKIPAKICVIITNIATKPFHSCQAYFYSYVTEHKRIL